jgi:hypothetical protein
MQWFLVGALYAMDCRHPGGLVVVTSLGNIGRRPYPIRFHP